MDAEAVVWLIFIAIWFISGIVQQIKKVGAQRPGQADRPQQSGRDARAEQQDSRRPERPLPEDDPMVQLLRKLGGEVEVQPEEPPRESPPQPARIQQRQAARATRVDASKTKVARMASIPEMDLPPLPEAGQPVTGRRGRSGRGAGALARSLRRDLRRPASMRKAILLQEILGKPPGLQGLRG